MDLLGVPIGMGANRISLDLRESRDPTGLQFEFPWMRRQTN
jgi:hypothetical protein